ncbi:Crp/Fnr family transcriptional regulator [Rossellomorea vietnamensis]|uniref:Crp/Fnr family transcriptional regulator n=1 Tax=Rossellomorea vietnamensis TaxID=218284 RepID=A0A5D4NNH4_9BACI|nr:Crp/Fnr family transcriptional regulator [Rossellomorea vietnamensis]TYS15845.1 Crp/Fnr family transcriptional regulator [Rossellomorea vietnamensis]
MSEPNNPLTEIESLFTSQASLKKVEKGRYLFQEGETAHELFLVKSGKVQIGKVIPDGRELSMRICSNGDVIGELTLFCDESTYMLNAKVMEDSEIYILSKQIFEENLSNKPQLTVEWLKWVQLQSRKNQTKFRDLILHGKKGALYSTLIRLTNSYGKPVDEGLLIDYPMTNQELANFCGTSREVVNRMLSELRKEKIVIVDKNKIIVHDLDYLKKEIDCENCPINVCTIK